MNQIFRLYVQFQVKLAFIVSVKLPSLHCSIIRTGRTGLATQCLHILKIYILFILLPGRRAMNAKRDFLISVLRRAAAEGKEEQKRRTISLNSTAIGHQLRRGRAQFELTMNGLIHT